MCHILLDQHQPAENILGKNVSAYVALHRSNGRDCCVTQMIYVTVYSGRNGKDIVEPKQHSTDEVSYCYQCQLVPSLLCYFCLFHSLFLLYYSPYTITPRNSFHLKDIAFWIKAKKDVRMKRHIQS